VQRAVELIVISARVEHCVVENCSLREGSKLMSDTPCDHKTVQPFIKASRRSEIVAKLATQAASLALAASATIGAAQASNKSAEVTKGHAETHKSGTLRPDIMLASNVLPNINSLNEDPEIIQKPVNDNPKTVQDTKIARDTVQMKRLKEQQDKSKDIKESSDTKTTKEGKEVKEDKDGKEASDSGGGGGDGKLVAEEDGLSPMLQPNHGYWQPTAFETGNTRNLPVVRLDIAIWTPLTADVRAPKLKPATLLMRKPMV
jgi:hypothetical protein